MKVSLVVLPIVLLLQAAQIQPATQQGRWFERVKVVLAPSIAKEAAWAVSQQPVTVTSSLSSRSAGGIHEFFSEGDYWWPDPRHVDSPYIQRDGMTNPENFVDHRKAMIRFSRIMGALASAYLLNKDEQYAVLALKHARAWFMDAGTLMLPHLRFAQAIKGRFTGRGIGIIDTIHLLEVAKALEIFEKSRAARRSEYLVFRKWFADYLNWMTTHPYGIDESRALNNHGTCWTLQVAGFASFTGNDSLMQVCRERFETMHLPGQMAADGSFPKEIARTKPYGYSLFNLDAMVMICQVLENSRGTRHEAKGTSEKGRGMRGNTARHEALGTRDKGRGMRGDLWAITNDGGRSIRKGVDFLLPYVQDKKQWPYKQDVMYWNEWPVAQPFLVFAAAAYGDEKMFNLWAQLNHEPANEEVIRNLPIRHPLIWIKN
jgi:Alginate lyase